MNESTNTSTDTSEAIAASPRSGARLRKLFFETLYLSAFTFGGGYVIVSLLKKKFVDDLHWISEDEMLDLVAIAQSAPGPIAVNGAIVVGYKICGFPGILLSVLGAVIPPFVMLSVISLFYSAFRSNFMIHHMLSGMRCGVSAVIMSVTWDMASGVLADKKWSFLVIMLAAFVANYILGISTIWIILAVIALGVAVTLWRTHHTPATTPSAANAADPHAQMASPTTPAATASDTSDSPDHTNTEEVQK